MRSRPLARSLTARLTLLFGTVSLAVMAAVGLHLYHVLARELAARDQAELDGKVELVRNLLHEFDSVAAVAGAGKRWREVFVGHHGLHFNLLDKQGRSLVTTSAWEPDPSLVRAALATPLDAVRPSEWQDAHGKSLRVTAAWGALGATDERALIVVAREQDERIELLRSLGLHVVIAVVLGGAVTALLGFTISRASLTPVRRIARTANEITASDLDRRLDVESAPDELKMLALSFNRMLERLQDSFRRLSDFSTDIAHDIRTPINNLLGQTQVALGRPRSATELREVLESNVEEYERMARMVDDMLFLARAENAQAVLQRASLNLSDEVRKVLAFFEPLAQEREIRTRVQGEATVFADRSMVQRMLGNLLSNALRHARQGGDVGVRMRTGPDGSVELAVTNAGEPIAAEQLPRLFDRFYRADTARSRSSAGAGLGLAIVKSIAELHGGRVAVSSTLAEGTRFVVYLPPAPSVGTTAPGGPSRQ